MSTAANWSGFLKRVYGALQDPLPPVNTLREFFPFETGKAIGDSFEYPILTGLEHGVTHDNTRTAFDLLGAIDSVAPPARLRGSAINLEGDIPRDMLHAMDNGQMASYKSALDQKVLAVGRGCEHYAEIATAYGCGSGAAAAVNIGAVSTVSGATLNAIQVVDLTRASWSGGLWNRMVGAKVDIYQADGSTLRASEVTVNAIAKTNNRVTLYKSGSAAVVAATDIIVPRGALTKSCYGVQAILENTGTMFELSAATYPSWKSHSYAAGGALTRAKLLDVMAELEQNGVNEGARAFVNGKTFAVLVEESNTLARFPAQTAVRRQGASKLIYETSAGDLEIVNYMLAKQSLAFVIANGKGARVGSTDVTFSSPGSREFHFQELTNKAGAKIQAFANFAPLIKIPAHAAIITGITNTGDTLPSA